MPKPYWLFKAGKGYAVRSAQTMEFLPLSNNQEFVDKMNQHDDPNKRIAAYFDDSRIIYEDGSSWLDEEIVCFHGLGDVLVFSTQATTYHGTRPLPVYLSKILGAGEYHAEGIDSSGLRTYMSSDGEYSRIHGAIEQEEPNGVIVELLNGKTHCISFPVLYEVADDYSSQFMFIRASDNSPFVVDTESEDDPFPDPKWEGGTIVSAFENYVLALDDSGQYNVYFFEKVGSLHPTFFALLVRDVYFPCSSNRKCALLSV